MLVLTSRLRRRTALTACSSDPEGCFTSRRQCGDAARAPPAAAAPAAANSASIALLHAGGAAPLAAR